VKLNSHVLLVPRLRMSGVIPALPHVFMACTETSLLLTFYP
jgi:hypothetical protein